jgi:MFS family permease
VAPHDFKSKAISLVLAGGVVAAFTGPELAKLGREWMGGIEFMGTYVLLMIVSLASAIIVLFVDIPKLDEEEAAGPQRSLGTIMRAPIFIVASGTATLGYLVMNLLMTSTPLAMQMGSGLLFNDVALVLEWHIFAMFAPGFFTGSLIRRFGHLPIIAMGNLALMAGVAAGLAGQEVTHFWVALFMIGFGWNFAFTGGSALLVEAHTPAERAKVQGANDFIIATFMSISSLVSGMLYHVAGWTWVNLATLPLMAASLTAVLWLAFLNRRSAQSAA